MSKKNEAFNNWEEWAKYDWKEFYDYFTRKYGIENFKKIENEFANQMGIPNQSITILTNIALGKVIEKGASATLGSILTFADFISSAGGYLLYWAGRGTYSRQNYHIPNFSPEWYEGNPLSDYVKYILYCYPRDLDEGYYGFRYGLNKDGSASLLRKIKKYP